MAVTSAAGNEFVDAGGVIDGDFGHNDNQPPEQKRVDLSKMSKKELEQLWGDVDKRLSELAKEERATAVQAVVDLMLKNMVYIEDLPKTVRRGGQKTAAEPKYRNPDNSAQTWTGKGRQPNWIKTAKDKGVNIDDSINLFLI